MNRDVTIWTSEPDYEEYRAVMEEDLPLAGEDERREFLRQANEACFEIQKEEMDVELGGPIVVLSEIETESGAAVSLRVLPGRKLSDCFERPAEGRSARWFVDGSGDLRSEERGGGLQIKNLYRIGLSARLGEALKKVYGIEWE